MRFVLAVVKHETNTFSPIRTPLTSFAIGRRTACRQLAVKQLRPFVAPTRPFAPSLILPKKKELRFCYPLPPKQHPAVR